MTKVNRSSMRASFGYAIEGLQYVLRTERNARIHLVAALLVVMVGLWLGLGVIEWALLVFSIVLVFSVEMLNTVVELIVDMVVEETHPLAKHAKDVAAGAVLIAAGGSAILGLLVLGPPLWHRVTEIFSR